MNVCKTCGLRSEAAMAHESLEECIAALREAMFQQREAASRLALDISTRFLAILEELSIHPESGLSRYTVWNKQEMKPEQVPPQQVAGVFANIRHAYEQMGDWSPLQELQSTLKAERLSKVKWSFFAGRCAMVLQQILSASVPEEVKEKIAGVLAELPQDAD